MPVSDLNALSLLRCNNLVMTADAFDEIQGIEAQHVAGEGTDEGSAYHHPQAGDH